MNKRMLATAVATTVLGALVAVPPGASRRRGRRPGTTDAVAWLVDQQEADGGFELADFPGFETPDAVLAIAEQAQVEPAWSKPLARAAVDAVVSNGGVHAARPPRRPRRAAGRRAPTATRRRRWRPGVRSWPRSSPS